MKIVKEASVALSAAAALTAVGLAAVTAGHAAPASPRSTTVAAAWVSHHQDFCDDDSDSESESHADHNHFQHPCQAKDNSFGKVKYDFFGYRF